MRSYSSKWGKYTSDSEILQTVKGMRIKFAEGPPNQTFVPHELFLSSTEKLAIDQEIARLLEIGVIEVSVHEAGEFVSTIFTRLKKDGKRRMILNLAKLNDHVEYYHFKMDTLEHAIKLITPNCYMASIDLRDAYYSVPIHSSDQKYLKFMWRGVLYKFTALPNGLSSGPREFTKLLKPPFSFLRSSGHTIVGYIDDTLLISQDEDDCHRAIADTTSLLDELGFIIHPKKSILTPTHEITFLGFTINSTTMTVKPTTEKCDELAGLCRKLRNKPKPSIQNVASVVGKIVAIFPGAQYGPLHYRELEKDKSNALRLSRGDYNANMQLSGGARAELLWWEHYVHTVSLSLDKGPYQFCLSSDASGKGWGISDGPTDGGGKWNDLEKARAEENQINYLELWAAFMALRAYCSEENNVHVKLDIDNTTAIAYINHMGGTKSHDCNELAKEMWEWCIERKIWVTACHLPGVLNTVADRRSREFRDQTEWELDRKVFQQICAHFGTPHIDLFASRLNTKLDRFVSWRPDPDAVAVDAFTMDWSNTFFYAFPPFCLITRCLQKITFDHAEGLLVVPVWPSQSWYGRLLHMLVEPPFELPKPTAKAAEMSNLDLISFHKVYHLNRLFMYYIRVQTKVTTVQQFCRANLELLRKCLQGTNYA